MATHSFLAPSSAVKWIPCAVSASLEAQIADEGSAYADEGTIAHLCAERAVRSHIWKEKFERDERFNAEMFEAADVWRKLIADLVGDISKNTLRIEGRIDVSSATAPGTNGTCDAWIYVVEKKRLIVPDFKYGKGIDVAVEHNPQLMIYGHGLLSALKHEFEIEDVELIICQPRTRKEPKRWVIKAKHLEEWAATVSRPAAARALSDKPGDPVAGPHCSKGFCKARFTCKARAQYATGVFKKYGTLTPKDPLMGPDHIGKILPDIAELKKWCNDMEAHAAKLAISEGKKIVGYKLVEGRGSRSFPDTDAVVELLLDYGFTKQEFMKESLVGFGDLEKLVGKSHEVFSLAKRVPGAPTLVPESDKRPEFVETREEAFDDDDTDDGDF